MPSFHSLYSLTVTLIVSAYFYMDMNCFGLVSVVSSWLWVGSVAANSLGWVVGMISGGFRSFWIVSDGFDWFVVLVVTFLEFMRLERSLIIWYILLLKKTPHNKRFVKFFHIVKIETENNFKTLYSPTDIAYDPVKHFKIKINCFFFTNKLLAYGSTYRVDKNNKKS